LDRDTFLRGDWTASRVGLSAAEIGITLDVLLDGVKVDDYLFEGEEIDLVLKGQDQVLRRTQDIDHIMIHTLRAGFVPLNSVSRLRLVSRPAKINHIEQHRAIVVRIIPPIEVSMEKAMKIVQTEIVDPLLKGRGLGSVVIGGLALSTIFTLFLVPSLFSLFYSLGLSVKKVSH